MAGDSGQRTEQPTPRRLEKARREGNFPASREFVSSIHFLAFTACAAWFAGPLLMRMARLMRMLLASAFAADLTLGRAMEIGRQSIAPELFRLSVAGGAMLVVVLGAQLATTRMGLAFQKLAPDFQRLNPVKRIASLPSQNLFLLAQAIAILGVVGTVVYREISENVEPFLELVWLAPQTGATRVGLAAGTLLWRASGLFLVIGFIDLVRNRRRYTKQLRMTKQEIREEMKEQEGSPHVKLRIRRIQRDLARRQMMKEIPNATAVIVNPTHYAVALRYSMDTPGAPRVVAKGKNYLAMRIRKRAIENQVPIVENPPLARALYSSVEVGQEIPSHLYRAVAEILAYIYKLMNGRLPN
ncbi:MAG: EscU/YscU/HrcU family type III secretion system export apparatus switch protein [Bryobacterales bacterium]|nr:EscU/YscU/HrcU family type III secretion system export apparatus switch protein [Bryobacterales bacterium]MBV9397165.1 EscU/YscU/HrcU family type III secretion system export apparatus switch protein [Bryobacterales bacterium]